MLGLDEFEQLLAGADFLVDAIADVRTIKAGDEFASVLQMQALDDFFSRQGISGSCERDPRDAREALSKHGKPDVLRPEVVTPLRNAMRFIDGEQRQLRGRQQLQAAISEQPLRRNVEKIQLAASRAALDVLHVRPAHARIERRSPHARLFERRHLILHQRNKRRHHDAHPLTDERGNLEAEGLAAAGRHQHERVPALRYVRDDVSLLAAKGGVSKGVPKNLIGARGCLHRESIAAPTVVRRDGLCR